MTVRTLIRLPAQEPADTTCEHSQDSDWIMVKSRKGSFFYVTMQILT